MKDRIKQYYEQKNEIIAACYIERKKQHSAMIDGFDAFALIITENEQPRCFTQHYSKDGFHIQERWFDRNTLTELLSSDDEKIVKQWILNAEILVDKQDYLRKMRESLQHTAPKRQKQQLFREFAKFLRHYWMSRNFLAEGEVLDAHEHILMAVHHLARISIIQAGQYPEMVIWRQIRKVNPGVFKLHEELVSNSETVEQRIQLAHLACEFLMTTKLEECCEPLLSIISSRQEPWSIAELEVHPELKDIRPELHMLLKKLVRKSLLREVLAAYDPELDLLELKYTSP